MSPPTTRLSVREDPGNGRAVLVLTASAALDGTPVAYTEYRVDKGRWRRGTVVEVRRRRIFSRVRYRSVDAAGAVEPAQVWEKNWPGLRAVECPPGAGSWTATYDWFRLRDDDRWWLDHPVCLVFHAAGRRPVTVGAVEAALRELGFRSRIYDLVRGLDLASDGGLALATGAPPDPFVPTAITQGVKLRLARGNVQSSAHVRVYAPPALPSGAEPGARPDGAAAKAAACRNPLCGSWVVGTCHLDVNELMRADDRGLHWGDVLPAGAPDPAVDAELIKYGGNSEWVEQLVSDLWEKAYGRQRVQRGAVPLGDPQDWFQVARRGEHEGRSWVVGKWWRSDGRATMLTLPHG